MSLQNILSVVPPGSPEEGLARQVNFDRLPRHVAVIMVTVIYNDLMRISWIERLVPWR